ncbi:MAG: hypothetical protein JNJ83_06065 [Verrucomicrobiaceae bacterium]|nr:hypothetical protein [Verrucomicrobiaceae bacterium]
MKPPFPSRQELRNRGYSPESLDLYDIWRHAHEEGQLLAARLLPVFGDPPRPRVTRTVADGFDDEWTLSPERQAELSAYDTESHWTEVTDEAIAGAQNYFAFSDAEGWRFYLPAFIRHYLKEFPLSGWDAVKSACQSRECFELLTDDQIALIDDFLALCERWEDRL